MREEEIEGDSQCPGLESYLDDNAINMGGEKENWLGEKNQRRELLVLSANLNICIFQMDLSFKTFAFHFKEADFKNILSFFFSKTANLNY